MTTTTSSADQDAWWSFSHDHSRRCWWNWEVARWICPTGADAISTETEPGSPSAQTTSHTTTGQL